MCVCVCVCVGKGNVQLIYVSISHDVLIMMISPLSRWCGSLSVRAQGATLLGVMFCTM